MAKAKICGLTKKADYTACAEAGAAFAGLVFHPRSPRHLQYEAAEAIADMRLSPGPEIVALCVAPDDGKLTDIIAACKPDWLQLHGHERPERCAEIRQKFALPILKAISVKSADDIIAANAYRDSVDMLLFDAATGNPDMPGGTGSQFDWSLLASADIPLPWMLAGGLTCSNIQGAIRQTAAQFVDVSSGVETKPGFKDHEAIKRFVSAADLG